MGVGPHLEIWNLVREAGIRTTMAPLTRHLYREDEVRAALMLSIWKGRCREAAFWCLEMLDSGLAEGLIEVLRRMWLLGFGARALGWWRALEGAATEEAIDPDRFLALAVGLARLGRARDTTVLGLLGAAAGAAVPDRVGARGWAEGGDAMAAYLTAAVVQGRVAAVAAAASTAGRGALAAATAVKHGEVGREVAAEESLPLPVLVAAACLAPKELVDSWRWVELPMPAEVVDGIAEWRAATGRRARRAMPIPMECLYWITERGRAPLTVYDSTEGELMRWRFARPRQLWGSEYWDGVAEEFGGWATIAEEYGPLETFYEREFPDDIPDEWSRAERAKSHGSGVLQRGAGATAAEWLRRWFGAGADSLGLCRVWRGVEAAMVAAGDLATLEELVARAEGAGAPVATAWNLRPVRRRIVGPPT